jgi:hypothetical protein
MSNNKLKIKEDQKQQQKGQSKPLTIVSKPKSKSFFLRNSKKEVLLIRIPINKETTITSIRLPFYVYMLFLD